MYRKSGDIKNVILVILRNGEDTKKKKKIGQKNRKKKEEKRNYPFAHKVDLHYIAIHKKITPLPTKWIFTSLRSTKKKN